MMEYIQSACISVYRWAYCHRIPPTQGTTGGPNLFPQFGPGQMERRGRLGYCL